MKAINLLVTVVSVLLLPAVAKADNRARNGDFEAGPFYVVGTVSEWSVTGNVESLDEGATTGTHAAALSVGNDSEGDTLSQNVVTAYGQTYSLDFDAGVFGVASGSPMQFRLEVIGETTVVDYTLTPPAAGTFDPSQVT